MEEGEASRSASRQENIERKTAELETINDKLRTENDVLLAEVAELRERLLSHEGLDQSDSSEGHDDERMEEFGLHISNGTHEPKAEKSLAPDGNLSANQNNYNNSSNSNGSSSTQLSNSSNLARRSSIKIATLKRKQKALKVELEQSLCQTMGFQESFQNEMDLRTKLEEKYDHLRVRYERLVLENDHFRTVLSNHCIDVPAHQPITGRRRQANRRSLQHPPPTFVPSGRQRYSLQKSTSPNPSISSKSSGSSQPGVLASCGGPDERRDGEVASQAGVSGSCGSPDERRGGEVASQPGTSGTCSPDKRRDEEVASQTNSLGSLPDDSSCEPLVTKDRSKSTRAVTVDPDDTPLGLGGAGDHILSTSDQSDSEEEEEEDIEISSRSTMEEGVDHIIIGDVVNEFAITSGTEEIDALLAVSTNQLTSARTFYEMARARLREEEEDSD